MKNTLTVLPDLERFVAKRNADLIGFDRFFDNLFTDSPLNPSNYPPYNIEKVSDDSYRISVAVAGLSREDLNISVDNGQLHVAGERQVSEDSKQYLYKGIANRSFKLKFQLADFVEVEDANLENGVLHIDLKRIVPEELKPRKIDIK